jgi:putative hydrolase of the HAD superfamily
MGVEAVFFDVGNTLLTPAQPEGLVFAEEAERHGVRLDPALVDANVPAMYQLYERLYEADDSFWSDDERAVAIWLAMYEHLCMLVGVPAAKRAAIAAAVHQRYFTAASWRAFDDVIPTLDFLAARGIRMGLISNWDSTLESVVSGLGLAGYFQTVISSTVVRMHKPMRGIFELALSRLGVGAEAAMHVGDHLSADARGARQAGLRPVLIDRGGRHAAGLDAALDAGHAAGLDAALDAGTAVIGSLLELRGLV